MNELIKGWEEITSPEDIDVLMEESFAHPVVVFKYSLTCSISYRASDMLEEKWKQHELDHVGFKRVNVIDDRPLSQELARRTGVIHQSPQLIIIEQGKAIFDTSHFRISYEDMKNVLDRIPQTKE